MALLAAIKAAVFGGGFLIYSEWEFSLISRYRVTAGGVRVSLSRGGE